ncbi:MAG: hypothetical protein P8J50_09455 [Acidimicrobiales bacterium]|nr:hypothetical protein [Acidimicrobiales bacterium]
MIRVDGATVLLQWAAGGWLFLWVTTRRREVGLGYGWLQRLTFLALAAGSLVAAFATEPTWTREIATIGFVVAGVVALGVSVVRRKAGVAGQRDVVERRTTRVAEMTGIDRDEQRFDKSAAEFPPVLDLVAACIGLVAVLFGSIAAGDPALLSVVRGITSALFLGVVTDAMLLGHWYLVQPGLARAPIHELVKWTGVLWVPETIVMLIPTGMVSLLNGTIDDAYNGLLGWFWIACVVTTIGLVFVTRAALKEREYSAVMAATGLMYLAILTAFGQDLVARILLDH